MTPYAQNGKKIGNAPTLKTAKKIGNAPTLKTAKKIGNAPTLETIKKGSDQTLKIQKFCQSVSQAKEMSQHLLAPQKLNRYQKPLDK